MLWEEFAAHDSPPFGARVVTVGAPLSIATEAAVPIAEGSEALAQSRSVISSITTVPGPPAAALVTARLNSVPAVAWVPHGSPSVALSIWYDPPPLSTTSRLVEPPPDARKPPSLIPL